MQHHSIGIQTGAELKETFDRDGFVIIRSYLSPPEVTEMRAHLDHYKSEIRPNLPAGPLGSMKNMNVHHDWFRSYLEAGRHIELLKSLLDDDLAPDGVIWNDKPAGMDPTFPHYDALGSYREPPSGISLWIALDSIDRSNGCLSYEKASHLKRFEPTYPLPDYDTNNPNAVTVEVEPGDAVIHGALTVHWSNEIVDQRSRNAMVYAYWGAGSKVDSARSARSTSAYKAGDVIL